MQTTRLKNRRRSGLLPLRLAIVCLFILALLLPSTTVAQDAPADGTPTDALTIEPTPTLEPTLEPTVEPTSPPETPTETPVPTEIPATETTTPTIEATATQTAIATATSSPTITPSPTPSPTATSKSGKPAPQTQSLVAAAAVGSCTIPSGIPTVAIGSYITFECTGDNPFKVRGDSLTAGWQWSYSYGSIITPTTWYTGSFTDTGGASGSVTTVYIYLGPTAGVLPGATGSLTVSILKPNGTLLGSSTVNAYAGVSSANFALSCTPNPITVPTSTNGVVNCSLSGVGIDPSAVVSVTAVNVSSLANWTITRSPATGTVTGTTPFLFTLTLTPVCGAAVNPSAPNVTITTSLDFHGTAVTGPSTSITAKHGATTTISASISGSSMAWSTAYSFAPQSVTGSLTYRATASGCAGWNIQLSATNLAYTGSFSGAAIPNGNIAITPGNVSAVSGSTSNVTPGGAGSLSSPLKVLSAIENSGIGTYDQSLAVGVTIPGGSRVGTYTSTITVTAASGP